MKYIIKNVLILDKRSSFYSKKVDVEIEQGVILRISKNILSTKNHKIIEGKKLVLSTGFVDINASSGEPNNLEAETLDSLKGAAIKGGFTHVAHMPGKDKPVQTKSDITYLISANNKSLCQILPIGNLTVSTDSNQLSAMMDMWNAGAVAFSDGNNETPKQNVLKNALLYSKGFQGRVMVHAEDLNMSKNGQVNQGKLSLELGYKGIPKEAEFMEVSKVLQVSKYTDSPILFLNVNTPESIKLISDANKKEKNVFSSTSTWNLTADETMVRDYDTNYKLKPPLRALRDRNSIVKAALSGKIDIIHSQHIPCTEEEKNLEFDLAACGAINVQTAVQTCIEALGVENIEVVIELMSTNPANYLNIELPIFDEGAKGSFTILDLKKDYVFAKEDNKSRSMNSPIFGKKFSTQIKGLISNGKESFS